MRDVAALVVMAAIRPLAIVMRAVMRAIMPVMLMVIAHVQVNVMWHSRSAAGTLAQVMLCRLAFDMTAVLALLDVAAVLEAVGLGGLFLLFGRALRVVLVAVLGAQRLSVRLPATGALARRVISSL